MCIPIKMRSKSSVAPTRPVCLSHWLLSAPSCTLCDGGALTVTGNGIPLKKTQGFTDGSQPRYVHDYACVVMEVEDWIDAINHPEWGREKKNVFGPGDGAYVLEAIYKFKVDEADE